MRQMATHDCRNRWPDAAGHPVAGPMPRFRCPECCCGPAIVLRPPRGATPICSRCGTVLAKQPLVRPIPLLVLMAVGTALVALSLPALFSPPPPTGPLQPGGRGSQAAA
jgi:hypothetical protein